MYFLSIYFLSSLPPVRMILLFTINTIKRKTIIHFIKQRNDLLFSLYEVVFQESIVQCTLYIESIVYSLIVHSTFLFSMATCFDPTALNVFSIFPKPFVSWNKAFFTRTDNSVSAIGIFSHTTMINVGHVQILKGKAKPAVNNLGNL